MRRLIHTMTLSLLLASAGACGGDEASSITCGENTKLVEGRCVLEPAGLCAAGTMLSEGKCVALSSGAMDMGAREMGSTMEMGTLDMSPSSDLSDMRQANAPEGWTCVAQNYDDGIHCDCECGVADPDCSEATLPVFGCRAPGAFCTADAICSDHIPESWTCAVRDWADAQRCHCACGAPDPDCGDDKLPITGCGSHQVCSEKGTCIEAP